MKKFLLLLAASILTLSAEPGFAQSGLFSSGYEDYDSFATDPVDLDNEASELFGRFFQNSFQLGTNILTGGLGSAYAAGVLLNMKFIFYFDKIWAGELGAGWAQHSGIYNATNTRVSGIDVREKMNFVPLNLGIRYGFDQEVLPRGFAVMNPYLSMNAEYVFRSESVIGTPDTRGIVTTNGQTLANQFTEGAVNTGTGVGVNFGAGMEFDVYKKKLYLGLDMRYHMLFWSDADVLIGKLDRRGNAFSILGSLTYNY